MTRGLDVGAGFKPAPTNHVIIRPTIAADLAALTDEPLPFRIRALTGLLDGRVIGVGGIGFMPGGITCAFAQLADEARSHKVALHRAALRFLRAQTDAGVHELVALADQRYAGAERWLAHLGFRPVQRNGETVWIWQTPSP